MTPEEFSKLSNNDKWKVIWNKEIINVLWCCASCFDIVDNGKTPTTMFDGERYCGCCDGLLTRRTGGGQNMPCNYTFIPNRQVKLKKLTKKINENKKRICE